MDDSRTLKLNEQITEEAASWFLEFRCEEPGLEARTAFDTWLRASPEHLRAFLEIAQLWNESERLDTGRRIDVDALLAAAGQADNIITLDRAPIGRGRTGAELAAGAPRARRRWLPLAAAASVALLGAALLVWAPWRAPDLYRTAIGERRSIRLSDGTIVTLDARTELRVAFTASARRVELLEGQALFQIAKDEARPFAVGAGGSLMRDIGTQFDVNRNLDGTTVTVLSGRVAVYASAAQASPGSANSPADEPILVAAGEQLRLAGGAMQARPMPVDSGSATAWRNGQIVLDASTLADVVEEFNRYSARQLIAEDHGATPLRLSGVFGIDPQFLIQYLRDRPDIRVQESADSIRIIRTTR